MQTATLPPKPTYPPFTGLPSLPALAHLQARAQWVVWDYRPNKANTKWTKPPLRAADCTHASHSEPRTWAAYDRAEYAARRNGLPGVGYVLTPDDDIGGYDIDGCRDPETGALAPWAADVLAFAETYAEVSPSGRGVRIFALGKPEKATKSDPAGVEVYATARFLTVTGRHIAGTPSEIRTAPKTLAALLARAVAFDAQVAAERERIRAAASAGTDQAVAGPKPFERFAGASRSTSADGSTFFRDVNSAAFANLGAWVPALFGAAAQPSGLGYRVSSGDLGRGLEEDLSITGAGAKDFGLHDQGDPKGGSRTAIDLVMEHGGAADAVEAALWLCDRLGIDPALLGWKAKSGRNSAAAGCTSADGASGKAKSNRSAKTPPPRGTNDTRPVITLRAGEIEEAVDAAEEALIAAGGLYQRGNLIVHMGEHPVKTHDDNTVSASRIFEIGEYALAERIASSASVMKWDARSEADVVTNPPTWLVKTLQQRTGAFRFSILTAVINAPTLRPDGSLLDAPGYDGATGLFFDPRGVEFPKIPGNPTRRDAERALADLSELLAGFPFVDENSRAVALSAILTACVRQGLPTAPMFGFSAPTAGSGKGKLVDIASVISTGREAGVIPQCASEEELEKRIDAELLEGAGAVAIDNCVYPVDGAKLCSLLTQPTVSIRPLGGSKRVTVSSSVFLSCTGNNLVIQGDMTRRVVVARLDAGVERPELRTFAFEPVAKAKAERVRYVVAALTIMRAYGATGAPTQAEPLGSYEKWSRLVRDSLLWLGCGDPVATMEAARVLDPKLGELAEVLAHWKSALGTDGITVRRIIEKATRQATDIYGNGGGREFEHPDMREALMAVAGLGGVINGRRLGHWLTSQVGRVVNGCSIEQAGTDHKTIVWKVVERKRAAAGQASEAPQQRREGIHDLGRTVF